MASTTIRVTAQTHATLSELAQDDGLSIQDMAARAVEMYRRQRIFDQANADFAALRADPVALAAWDAEVAAWDATLADGLPEGEVGDVWDDVRPQSVAELA